MSDPDRAPADPDRRPWAVLAGVLTAAFMLLVDVSIVNVAIPMIQEDLGASYGQIQLVLGGYQIAFAVVLITGGRLGDLWGRKRVFLGGMAGFVASSVACGAAPTPLVLVLSRVIQGVFAGVMYPQILSIIQVTFSGHDRARAFGAFGAVVGIATIAGPLLGGALIAVDVAGLSWRPIFFVNLIFGAGALAFAGRSLRESRAPGRSELDLGGVALATLALGLLIWPLVRGRELGWPWWSWAALAAAGPALLLFWRHEHRVARRNGRPLVPPALFSDRPFALGVLGSVLLFLGVPAFFLTLTLLLQIGLGFSPLAAGLVTAPFAVGNGIGSTVSARVSRRLGKRVIELGAAVFATGLAGLIVTLSIAGTELSGFETIPALAVGGLGLGLTIAPLVSIVLANTSEASAGAASGVLTTAQRVGGATGVALVGVVLFGLLGAHADRVAEAAGRRAEIALADRDIAARAPAGPDALARCVAARARAADPTELPAACAPIATAGDPGAAALLRREMARARAENYLYAARWTFGCQIGLLAVVLAVFVVLPRER